MSLGRKVLRGAQARRRPTVGAGRGGREVAGVVELGLGHRADDLIGHLAVLEKDEVRDAAHAELGRRLLVIVNVHLDDLGLAVVLAGKFLEHGGDGPAGAAPGSPEIDEHGHVGIKDLRLERRIGNFSQFAHFRSPATGGAPLVPEVGLEPTRTCVHRILSPACLPISPLRRESGKAATRSNTGSALRSLSGREAAEGRVLRVRGPLPGLSRAGRSTGLRPAVSAA